MCIKKYLFLLLAVLSLASCAGNGNNDKRQTLTVTIEPLRNFTDAYAGDNSILSAWYPKEAILKRMTLPRNSW